MATLFLDIDNTLIYSHRQTMNIPKRVVEILNGKEQSYISEQTYKYLTGMHGLQIVPVTTRTLWQFQRIENLLKDIGCEYALICNGAILLHAMELDQNWYNESLKLAGDELNELPKAEKWLQQNCGDTSTHSVFDVFVYAKSRYPERLTLTLSQYVDKSKVDVMCDRSKIYCIPKSLNKGTAIKRFAKRFCISSAIAAGDSDFDIPMLNQADIAIIPPLLSERVKNEKKIVVEGKGCFSDEICSKLDEMFSN